MHRTLQIYCEEWREGRVHSKSNAGSPGTEVEASALNVLLLTSQCSLGLCETPGYDSGEVDFNPGSYFTSLLWKTRVSYFLHLSRRKHGSTTVNCAQKLPENIPR
ncbi:hypothetical protein M758_3G094300 [Ceratodon purpureus]|nr:hypothetical protein M758_3G094300 [Ceratodon purpureus]